MISDFNPGTTAGQKIFLEKTKGLPEDKRLPLISSSSTAIMAYLRGKEQLMGEVVTGIPTEYTGGTAGAFKNLITQSPSIELERVQREAFRRFSTAIDEADPIPATPWKKETLDPATVAADQKTFYRRVDSNVVTEIIKGMLTPKGWADLLLEKKKFTFTDDTSGVETYDGPAMLKVLLEEIDPTSSVNIEIHRTAIEQARLHNYDNNVTEMIKDIEKHHLAIVENGGTYETETYRRHILAALLSGPNEVFNSHFKAIRGDVESNYGFHSTISPSILMSAAKTQYTNIERRGEWTKVDPKDAKMMALSTKLDKLQELKDKEQKPTGDGAGTVASGDEIIPGTKTLKAWRAKFVGKKITRDGREQNWCPHHVDPAGRFNGLYCSSHDEHTHAEWAKKNKDRARSRSPVPKPADNSDGGSATPNAGSMQISDALKNALCTNFCVTEDDLNKIVNSVGQEN